MSRESHEVEKSYWLESEFPRGNGDPDWYSYPGSSDFSPPLEKNAG